MRHYHGVTTRQLLNADGIGDQAIDGLLERGQLIRDQHGVYLLEGVPQDCLRRTISSLLAVGPLVAVTGLHALWVEELIEEPDGPVDLLVPHPRNPRRRKHARIRATTCFEKCGLHRIGIIPIVSRPWAVTDVARHSHERDLASLIVRGVRERWFTLKEVRLEAGARGVFPGSPRLAGTLTALETDLPYSRTEQRLARALRAAGLHPILNYPIIDGSGRRIGLADLFLLDVGLDVEVDGPHHWLPAQAKADRRRDRAMQQEDVEVRRFSVYEIDEDIDAVVKEVVAIVASLSGRRWTHA